MVTATADIVLDFAVSLHTAEELRGIQRRIVDRFASLRPSSEIPELLGLRAWKAKADDECACYVQHEIPHHMRGAIAPNLESPPEFIDDWFEHYPCGMSFPQAASICDDFGSAVGRVCADEWGREALQTIVARSEGRPWVSANASAAWAWYQISSLGVVPFIASRDYETMLSGWVGKPVVELLDHAEAGTTAPGLSASESQCATMVHFTQMRMVRKMADQSFPGMMDRVITKATSREADDIYAAMEQHTERLAGELGLSQSHAIEKEWEDRIEPAVWRGELSAVVPRMLELWQETATRLLADPSQRETSSPLGALSALCTASGGRLVLSYSCIFPALLHQDAWDWELVDRIDIPGRVATIDVEAVASSDEQLGYLAVAVNFVWLSFVRGDLGATVVGLDKVVEVITTAVSSGSGLAVTTARIFLMSHVWLCCLLRRERGPAQLFKLLQLTTADEAAAYVDSTYSAMGFFRSPDAPIDGKYRGYMLREQWMWSWKLLFWKCGAGPTPTDSELDSFPSASEFDALCRQAPCDCDHLSIVSTSATVLGN